MQQVNANEKIYKCDLGETVTFTFTAKSTNSNIFFRLRGSDMLRKVQGNTLDIPITRDLTIVFITFDFINESGTGGSYKVELKGSNNGSFEDKPSVLQAGDISPERRYAFTT
jgi:hypothetical protein